MPHVIALLIVMSCHVHVHVYRCQTDEFYFFLDIHSITPQAGSVNGGAVVTITGTGFHADELQEIEVDINGIPCKVHSRAMD